MGRVSVVVFDIDGVITSERAYWDCAGLTVLELLASEDYLGLGRDALSGDECTLVHTARQLVPESFVRQAKDRLIATNWDIAYLASCLQLIDLVQKGAVPVPSTPLSQVGIDSLRTERREARSPVHSDSWPRSATERLGESFFATANEDMSLDYAQCLNVYARELLGTWPFLFAAGDPLWKLCQRLFQEWYVGTEKLGGEVGRQGPKRQKRGLIHDESPIIPVGRIRSALSELTDAGLRLCVATGRPRRELLSPLERWGLLEFFDPKHVATYDDVQQAETLAGREGACIRLSKPHPFLILRAVLASADPLELARGSVSIEGARSVCVVGDSVADVVAASSVGCLSMGVLTGVDGVRGRSTLERAGVNLVADDVGMVPGVLRGVGLL